MYAYYTCVCVCYTCCDASYTGWYSFYLGGSQPYMCFGGASAHVDWLHTCVCIIHVCLYVLFMIITQCLYVVVYARIRSSYVCLLTLSMMRL